MPRAEGSEYWNNFVNPNDDYDYEQHMLTEAKAKEIYEQSGGRQQIYVMVPANLSELEKDPYFTGELERNLETLPPDERALCLRMKDECDSLSCGSASDVELIIDSIISPEVAARADALLFSASEDADSMKADLSDDGQDGDVLGAALATYIEPDLEAALHEMDQDDDFEDATDSVNHDDIRLVNECVGLYNESVRMTPIKSRVFSAAENRKFIEEAVARQLDEEDESDDDVDKHTFLDTALEDTDADAFQFDKTLLVNMASAESARQRQQATVKITQAKHADLSALIF